MPHVPTCLRTRPAALALLVLPLSLCLSPAGLHAQAANLVPPGSKARLTVEYSYESANRNPERKANPWNWQTRRSVRVETLFAAQKPAPTAALQPPDAAQLAQQQQLGARAQATAAGMSDLMAGAQAIMDKCGDDEACITRESMQLGARQDPADVARMRREVNAVTAAVPTALRYQSWLPLSQTATYSIDESADLRDRDPICIGWPQDTCLRTEVRKGGGKLDFPPEMDARARAGWKGVGMVEHDVQQRSLTLQLPAPVFPLTYTQQVASSDKGGRMVDRGSTTQRLSLRLAEGDYMGENRLQHVNVSAASWKLQQGQYTVKQPGSRWNGGTLTVKWKFEAL